MNPLLVLPELIVGAMIVLLLVMDFALPPDSSRKALGVTGLVGTTVALAAAVALWGVEGSAFGGLLAVDTLAVFFKIIFLLAAMLVFGVSFGYLERFPGNRGEYYWLVTTALLGMMVTAAGRELITIYVGIELISLSFYALVGFHRERSEAIEAALKYFILGSFAIALWLYGAALVYGITGHTDLAGIAAAFTGATPLVLFIGLFLLIAGFGFKMGLAPFHTWVPDAYQGAPTPVAGFLAVGSKSAAFAVFIRVMSTAFHGLAGTWITLLIVLAVLTMTWGNTAALRQVNIKRMLAYSGVAHAGYTLIGVVAFSAIGVQGVMFYLLGYLFATIGAFAVVAACAHQIGGDGIAGFAGLHRRNPFMALAMAICLLSLAGIPPLAGFFGKFYLFWGAVQQGGWMLPLVVIAAINSAISLFYYVNVIRTMYFLQPEDDRVVVSGSLVNVTVAVAVAGLVLAAFYFQPVVSRFEATSIVAGVLGLGFGF